MGRVPSREGSPEGCRLTDIFAGQATDAQTLAELYDLEHDEQHDDLVFYREFARRARGAVLDLGTGSGRLLSVLHTPGRRLVGIDGSPELLDRARRRVEANPALREAAGRGELELIRGDVVRQVLPGRFSLVVAVDVVPHLTGADDAVRMLSAARRRLTRRGRIIVDLPGPAVLPEGDLPLDEDWERHVDGARVRRSSRLSVRRAAGEVAVTLSAITEIGRADGTIARLPAAFRLWYPDLRLLKQVFARAGLGVSAIYGSHELDTHGDHSERLIMVGERPERPRYR